MPRCRISAKRVEVRATLSGPIAAPPSTANQEIEVTTAMREAGVAVLWESGIVDGRLGADILLVAEIYLAMVSCLERLFPITRRYAGVPRLGGISL
ncbi:hypothetical protein BQ8482_340026 [Mesorhizobium delmotii]|uniref:Uncharacterized protein n=1 Tax=Mesorhizobium delmotii TaxID=1631247 RepID=A0A2P9APP3_9HYPH|nr:hypothetical protein BQ8482_340026 [Mesorhizobium delmotii]